MKRFLLTLTFFCLVLISHAYDFESDGIYYKITSSAAPYTVSVTYETCGGTDNYNGGVSIPSTTTYDGITYTVTSIGTYAFYDSGKNDSSFGTTLVSLPSTITAIQGFAFMGCRELTSIDLPSSLTSISQSAFYGCTGLTSISIPDGVSYINTSLFQNCTSLSSVSLPSSLSFISANAFDGCTSLTSITLPVHTIMDNAFNGCSNLDTIYCLRTTPPSITSTSFSNYSATVVVPCSSISAYQAASYWSNFSNYSIAKFTQDGIRYQPNSSCSGVTVLPNSYSGSVTIPSSVTYNSTTYAVTAIGDSAFYGCTGLTSVTIPEGVTSIGIRAFYQCTKITALNIPSSVTSIGIWAFYQCTGLTSVIIQKGITSINDYTFYCCNELTSLTIPEGVTSIGISAISNCYKLSSITIPSTVISIGMYAFFGCPFTSLTIPEGVSSIGLGAFRLCTGLTSVIIPSSISSIGDYAFSSCTGLTSVYAQKTTPASITMGSQVFINVDKTSCILHVPTGKISAYQEAAQWQDFTNIVEPALQTITFDAIATKTVGDADFTVTATGGASGNPIIFTSSDTTVAKCTGTYGAIIHIVNAGSCTLTATQAGNNDYVEGTANQTLTVYELPSVTTSAVSDITLSAATGNGNITSLGYPANVTAYGVCWSSTNSTPTTSDNYVDNGTTIVTGAFTTSISKLISGTTYYVRAYATNVSGTTYGNMVSFTTLSAPTVTTEAVSDISSTNATGNGNITSLGYPASATAYGVCWNKTGTPTISDSKADNGATSVTGAFTASMTSLMANITYYVRAYATNTAGTSYGEEVTFTTLASVPTDLTLSDSTLSDGVVDCFNAYDTITVAASGTVTLESGSSVEVIAGKSILFLPGFHAESGSYLYAHITSDSTFCDGGSESSTIAAAPAEKSQLSDMPVEPSMTTAEKNIKVYPNPNNGQFILELVNVDSGSSVCLYNLLGSVVYRSVTSSESTLKINLQGIEKGIYFVKVADKEKQLTKKIVVN